jgi:hypothetical protein
VSGYLDGTFRPEQNVNFVEAAKIIAIANGYSETASENKDPWFRPYVNFLASDSAIPMTIQSFEHLLPKS